MRVVKIPLSIAEEVRVSVLEVYDLLVWGFELMH